MIFKTKTKRSIFYRFNLFIQFYLIACLISCSSSSFEFNGGSKKEDPQDSKSIPGSMYQTRTSAKLLFETETMCFNPDDFLDILIVVSSNNSEAMKNIRSSVGTKLNQLLGFLQDTDWRIGITSTNKSDPCLVSLIKKDEPDIETKFFNSINLGSFASSTSNGNSSSKNQGIYRIKQALTCQNELTGSSSWIRDNSSIAVIIISDEDESEQSYEQEGSKMPSDRFLASFFQSIRTPAQDLKMYGIIKDPSDQKCKINSFKEAPIYSSVINQTEGLVQSICDSNYNQILGLISQEIMGLSKKTFTLKHQPVSLQIFYNGISISSGYKQILNQIRFDQSLKTPGTLRFEYFYQP